MRYVDISAIMPLPTNQNDDDDSINNFCRKGYGHNLIEPKYFGCCYLANIDTNSLGTIKNHYEANMMMIFVENLVAVTKFHKAIVVFCGVGLDVLHHLIYIKIVVAVPFLENSMGII